MEVLCVPVFCIIFYRSVCLLTSPISAEHAQARLKHSKGSASGISPVLSLHRENVRPCLHHRHSFHFKKRRTGGMYAKVAPSASHGLPVLNFHAPQYLHCPAAHPEFRVPDAVHPSAFGDFLHSFMTAILMSLGRHQFVKTLVPFPIISNIEPLFMCVLVTGLLYVFFCFRVCVCV